MILASKIHARITVFVSKNAQTLPTIRVTVLVNSLAKTVQKRLVSKIHTKMSYTHLGEYYSYAGWDYYFIHTLFYLNTVLSFLPILLCPVFVVVAQMFIEKKNVSGQR